MGEHTERGFLPEGEIILGDAREVLASFPAESVDLSFWSPPYYVGKSYEEYLGSFADWQDLIREVVSLHGPLLKPGGFMAVNIADILCFPDEAMPRFQADTVSGKRSEVTREQILEAQAENPGAARYELAEVLGCSEQTVQRRLEGNNVRGGKQQPQTKIKLTGHMLEEWAWEEAGLYLYDQRIWRKDPSWANSRWHSVSYRAVDEFEHVYVFWKPGVTVYDRNRLTPEEWSQWGSRGVWEIRSVRNHDLHEAEFPEELPSRAIRLLTSHGETVLDPFCGSGTTLLSAQKLGRKWAGIDIDLDSVATARERLRLQ